MIKATVFIASVLFFIPTAVFSYSPTTTHAGLTEQIVEFYNLSFGAEISDREKELIIDGAIEEDNPPTRALNHFYDPVRNIGINGGNTSKKWALDSSLVANDYSWPKIIRYYAEGDREKALFGLGHILHLIEDASVPEHTRNDPHIGDGLVGMFTNKSPFEEWTNENKTRDTLKGLAVGVAGEDVVIKKSLGEYFDFVAGYSNGNFYSADTIENEVYQYEAPIIVSVDKNYAYGVDNLTNEKHKLLIRFTLKGGNDIWGIWNEESNDTTILSSYFTRLSKQAVLAGAGVVDLFFREAEVAREEYLVLQKQEQEKEMRKAQELADSLSRSGFVGLVYNGLKIFVVDKIVTPIESGTKFAINSFKSGTLAIGQRTGSILAIGKFSAGTATTIGTNKANKAKEKVLNVLDDAQTFVQATLSVKVPKNTNEAFLSNVVNDNKLQYLSDALNSAKDSVLSIKKDVESFSEDKKEIMDRSDSSSEATESKYLLVAYSPGFGGGGSSSAPQTSEQNTQEEELLQEQSSGSEAEATDNSENASNNEGTNAASSTPPTITSPSDFSLSFATTTVTFAGTATASSTVEALYQRLVSAGATTTEEVMATTTVLVDESWSMDLVFSVGTTTVSFIAISEEGERSTSTDVVLNIKLLEESVQEEDSQEQERETQNVSQPPVVLSPVNGFVSTSTTVLFSGTASSTDIISTDFSSATTTANEVGAWSLLLSEFEQGMTTVSFFASDINGSASNSTEISIFVDSVSPEMDWLTVLECAGTLSVDKEVCLIPNLALNISWLSSYDDIDYYSIDNNGSISTTTATSTVVIISPDDIDEENNVLTFSFSVSVIDLAGNVSTKMSEFIEINLYPLVINEVAWAGTLASSVDEWIEIANNTIHEIDLSNVVLESDDGSPQVELFGTMPRFSYYLVERKNGGEEDESTESPIVDVVADVWTSFGAGLKNTGEVLSLSYTQTASSSTIVLDRTPDVSECGGWCGGTAGESYFSMERINQYESGLDLDNWKSNDGVMRSGVDVDGIEINGTPRSENSSDTGGSGDGGGDYDFDAGDIVFSAF